MAASKLYVRLSANRNVLFWPLFYTFKALCWIGLVHPAEGARIVVKYGASFNASKKRAHGPQGMKVKAWHDNDPSEKRVNVTVTVPPVGRESK